MAYQFSTTLRTNMAAQIRETVAGSGVLKIFSGAEPANCAASDPSGLLCTIDLPATPFSEASGVSSLAGSWTGTGSALGTAACFRVYDGSSNCHMQGSVGWQVSGAWAQSTAYTLGQMISNGGNAYQCTTAGTSAATGTGPSGTGSGITDGTAVWEYVGPIGDMGLNNTSIASGQTVTISTYTTTIGNA